MLEFLQVFARAWCMDRHINHFAQMLHSVKKPLLHQTDDMFPDTGY